MAMSKLPDKQNNYNTFAQIVQNEFPKALRQVFESVWIQKFEDSYPPFHYPRDVGHSINSLQHLRHPIPFDHPYGEWSTTNLFDAILFLLSPSEYEDVTEYLSLLRRDLRNNSLLAESFHSTLFFPTGNCQIETTRAAVLNLRVLKIVFDNWSGLAEMEKPMFHQILLSVKNAFRALGLNTDTLDFIGNPQLEFSAEGLRSLGNSGTWAIVERIGGGGFGEVHKLVHCLTRTVIAVKIVEIDPSKKEHLRQLENEIKILTDLRHERIVSCYGGEQKDDHLYLFMDYMAEGSLADLVKKRGALDERLSSKNAKQILEGVHYLHSNDIIHRDIKGPNILLDGDGNLKLADFGLARTIEKVGSKTSLTTVCGTWNWMAPEVVRGETYGRKADIWSVGCTVLEMLTGGPPLKSFEQQQVIFKIGSDPTQPKLPEGISQAALEFLKATLAREPSERPSSEELLTYKFITEGQENE